ncbi:CCKAR (predicted) [Pycnogonum litorale]
MKASYDVSMKLIADENYTEWKMDGENDTAAVGDLHNRTGGDDWYPDMHGWIRIPLYSIIFVMAVIGNSLVIVTLIKNRRMRVVTNVYLLNLAVADLLLGTFCMPFTLAGSLLREFMFGEIMCKIIPYFQAVSVSVSAWTLVVISLERYFAVCDPIKSRTKWRNLSHAYKIIASIWTASFLFMSPIAVVNKLMTSQKTGKSRCREVWTSRQAAFTFSITLDVILLLIPLVIMTSAYVQIIRTLSRGIEVDRIVTAEERGTSEFELIDEESIHNKERNGRNVSLESRKSERTVTRLPPFRLNNQGVRLSNADRCLSMKKKVIRMLIVVVLEFFVCWTPIFVINSMNPNMVSENLQGLGISIIHLLSYVSSCCNPITYCFMNQHFRSSFMRTFGCKAEMDNRVRQRYADETRINNGIANVRKFTMMTTTKLSI